MTASVPHPTAIATNQSKLHFCAFILHQIKTNKCKSKQNERKVTGKEILHLNYMLCIQQYKEVIVPPLRPEPFHYSVMFATL